MSCCAFVLLLLKTDKLEIIHRHFSWNRLVGHLVSTQQAVEELFGELLVWCLTCSVFTSRVNFWRVCLCKALYYNQYDCWQSSRLNLQDKPKRPQLFYLAWSSIKTEAGHCGGAACNVSQKIKTSAELLMFCFIWFERPGVSFPPSVIYCEL